jgi:hypothetical protein
MSEETKPITVVFAADQLAQIEEYAAEERARRPRVTFTTSDAVRALIDRGFAEFKRKR